MNTLASVVICLNLSVPSLVYEEMDANEANERAVQQDLRERSDIRLGDGIKTPKKSRIQLQNRGLKNSRTNVSFGFPI